MQFANEDSRTILVKKLELFKEVTNINIIKFGHTCYGEHLYKIGVVSTPNSNTCNVREVYINVGVSKQRDPQSTVDMSI